MPSLTFRSLSESPHIADHIYYIIFPTRQLKLHGYELNCARNYITVYPFPIHSGFECFHYGLFHVYNMYMHIFSKPTTLTFFSYFNFVVRTIKLFSRGAWASKSPLSVFPLYTRHQRRSIWPYPHDHMAYQSVYGRVRKTHIIFRGGTVDDETQKQNARRIGT